MPVVVVTVGSHAGGTGKVYPPIEVYKRDDKGV